jgi:soluble lytic murein transglycosylase-like protein
VIAALLASARLCGALVSHYGAEVGDGRACRAAVIAVAVADEWPAELVAAIAYAESRFDPRVVNARTGVWGAMQVSTRTRDRGEWAGYRAGVAKLRDARAYCHRRGDVRALCVLAGYRSGPAGVRGRWYRGPRAVLRRAALIRRAAELRVAMTTRATVGA